MCVFVRWVGTEHWGGAKSDVPAAAQVYIVHVPSDFLLEKVKCEHLPACRGGEGLCRRPYMVYACACASAYRGGDYTLSRLLVSIPEVFFEA